MKKWIFVPALLGAFAVPAWAYIPPSSFILKSVASKHAGLKGLRIRSTVTVMEGEQLGTARFKAVTFYNNYQNATLHAYAFDERNQKLFGIERRPEDATAADAVLFWKEERSISSALKARGLPIKSEDELLKLKDEDERRGVEDQHLARSGSGIAWVIGGAKPNDPQIWVEKDTFLPLRLIAGPQPDSAPVEIQFEGQRYYHEFPYPKTITALKKKVALFKDEVIDVALSLDAAEFRSPVVPGFTEAGRSAPSAVRDLIQQYFEVLR